MKKIILIGGGGHCKSVIDVIENEKKYKICGIIDKPGLLGTKVLNYEIIGNDSDLEALAKKFKYAFITIGHIKSPKIRIKLFKQTNNTGVAKNFYFVFKQSLSDYFIWLAGDDVISKNYIESNLKTLLKNSDCSFAASPNCYEGDEIHISKHINFSIKGSLYEKSLFFLKNAFFATGCNFAIYKKEILNKCPNLDSNFLGHDWKVITNSLLYGNFCRSQDGLIVLGKGGLSASNEFLIKERNKFIEYFIPLFEFSKFFYKNL